MSQSFITHAVAWLLGLDDGQGKVGLEGHRLAPPYHPAAHHDPPGGERNLLADLALDVPPSPLRRRGDELGADVAL